MCLRSSVNGERGELARTWVDPQESWETKLHTGYTLVFLVLGTQRERNPWALWLASLANLVSSSQ